MSVVDQRAAALERANLVRVERAKLRRRVQAGEISAAKLLAEGAPEIACLEVFDFVRWLPKVNRVRAARMLRGSGLPDRRRLEHLTVRQHDVLLDIVAHAEQHYAGAR